MAGHLADAGHEVTVYNRSLAKSAAWCQAHAGRMAENAADAVGDVEIVFTCLADVEPTRDVFLRPGGALGHMRAGVVLVDHATGTPAFARELAGHAARLGLGCLDAPVTGGVPGATAGMLGIMAGGEAADFALAVPAMQCYGRQISLMGPSGAGHMTKLVNVICVIGMGQALAEGLAFAERAGLDMARLIEVLMAGSTRSYLLEHKGPAMVSGTHLPANFTVDLALANVAHALDEAARLGAKLPLLALTRDAYAKIQAQGDGGWDTSSLIETLR